MAALFVLGDRTRFVSAARRLLRGFFFRLRRRLLCRRLLLFGCRRFFGGLRLLRLGRRHFRFQFILVASAGVHGEVLIGIQDFAKAFHTLAFFAGLALLLFFFKQLALGMPHETSSSPTADCVSESRSSSSCVLFCIPFADTRNFDFAMCVVTPALFALCGFVLRRSAFDHIRKITVGHRRKHAGRLPDP